jgi:3-oxoacyl-(acyl-carrier-protein) synthase/3-hydroxymyristoyl/3-hydroxydecanoyl-(acyl carrier protein) dehydratase/1-acyl-sn-glycerol-3-phosphate acyltransferase
LPVASVLGTPTDSADRTWSDAGGYVEGFDEVFDPRGFLLPPEEIRALDPVFQWTLHGVRAALRGAREEGHLPRGGLVLGNLSYPSAAMARFAECRWLAPRLRAELGILAPDPRNRFMSGLPALLGARCTGLGGGAFALDAACASSLYAIKLACDRLHDGSAELMVAGAVNSTDDLFIHIGFSALGAMSRTGRSRPFHRDADGLVPGEGAAFVVLKRLSDALAAGNRILGILRGAGLSNDGRGRGLLAPAEEGQVRAMRLAYESSGLSPRDVSLLECHATGTAVGDATEVRSTATVFAGCDDVPIGSLKSNLGHLVTAAGVAGLLKVIGAMEAGVRPPTLGADEPHSALAGTPLRLLHVAEPWDSPRRLAAVSAFGFGGNNAHLLVEAYDGSAASKPAVSVVADLAATEVAVVGLGARVGDGECAADFAQTIFAGTPQARARETASVALEGLRFPPRDLEGALPQQLLVLEAAREAAAGLALPRERTAVLVGMGCDPEAARHGARWRARGWAEAWARANGGTVDDAWLATTRDALARILDVAGVVGRMPNIPANRISSQLDAAGPGFTVSAEEGSGLVALGLAARALRAREIDAALVGAVDLSHEPVQDAAISSVGGARPLGDAAVVLALKRLEDARRDGDPILALLDGGAGEQPALRMGEEGFSAASLFGHAHAAVGLVEVAAALVALRHGGRPNVGAPASPWVDDRRVARVEVRDLEGGRHTVSLRSVGAPVEVASAQRLAPTGARMTVAAHAPVVVGPPALAPSRMARAPSLPPVIETTPSVGPAAHPVVPSDVLARTTAHAAQVATLHREHLAKQAELHSQFLAVRERMVAALFGSGVSPAPAMHLDPLPGAAAAPLPGPRLGRPELEVLATAQISSVFGPAFADEDGFRRQVRMPAPPLLLADRVLGIDGSPGSMGTGRIWTETDVGESAWYLDPSGRMPAGVLVEAGQADLLLISWLGADRLNRGERVYRLLGCEMTFHAGPGGVLPRPGETLKYAISVDGHAAQGDVRLFFFHYDCTLGGAPRLSVRGGQAGFFTDEELAASSGVLWDPSADRPSDAQDPPPIHMGRATYDAASVRAVAQGSPWECFGPSHDAARAHVRTPNLPAGRLALLDEVTDLDPAGGAWGRGLLRAETAIRSDAWFFAGHFKNDPCMPGTLMFEGALQAMAFYLTALGFTLRRDGWRFEPVPDEKYVLRCRGQVTPASRRLVYEIHVRGVSSGPLPTLWADLLCTVDGLRAFHARRVGLRLVPDWPLEDWRRLGPRREQHDGAPIALATLGGLVDHVESRPVAAVDGFAFDLASLYACAWGRPSSAFGTIYARFDGTRTTPRLPGPPYLFMSRVARVEGAMGAMSTGSAIVAEYDVPDRAWFFAENGAATMPLAVLMEAALQPCGWLASFTGCTLGSEQDLRFRNLDGTMTLHAEVAPGAGPLSTHARLTKLTQTTDMILVSFVVESSVGDARILEMTTTFGFFPEAAFADQPGLPSSDEDRARLVEASDFHVDLRNAPRYTAGNPRLAGPMLRMLDRVTGFWPRGGRAGLGRLRAEKDVDPSEWFFKAHFFQDPVQPGSLGIEALTQLVQFWMLETGSTGSRFEPLMVGRPVTWKYRGQVVPSSRRITTEIEIVETGTDERGRYAIARGSLWVDGKRIYEVHDLGMRAVPVEDEEVLDPSVQAWLGDHRPTWTVPALPLASMVDRLAAAAQAKRSAPVRGLRDVQVHRWLPIEGPVRLRTEVCECGVEDEATLLAWREARDPRLSRFEPVATGFVSFGERADAPAQPFAPLPHTDTELADDPYAMGSLFHGPAFRYLKSLRLGSTGSSAVLRVDAGTVPRGHLHQGLLDAMTHAVPHDALWRWSAAIPRDRVGFPYRIPSLTLHGPLPATGEAHVEARFAGFDGDARFPVVDLQLIVDARVVASMRLVEILVPTGRLGDVGAASRVGFVRDRRFVDGVGLSRVEGEATSLRDAEVHEVDWLRGTVASLYRVPAPHQEDLTAEVAIRDHVARRAHVHPSTVTVSDDLSSAVVAVRPLRRHDIVVQRHGDEVVVRDAGPPRQDLSRVRTAWRDWFSIGQWPGEDLFGALIARFVGDVVIADPEAFGRIQGRACLYLANHQVGIESLLFTALASGLTRVPTAAVAKAEHRTSWIGWLIRHVFSWPGVVDPELVTLFDRDDRAALFEIAGRYREELAERRKSLLVHVEGTRSLVCSQPVEKVSSVFLDLALASEAPIVPVRFVGGLPTEPLPERIEFPYRHGAQDYWIGRPLLPEELRPLPLRDRKAVVLAGINNLGPGAAETPGAGDEALLAASTAWSARSGASPEAATVLGALTLYPHEGDELRRIVEGLQAGRLAIHDGEKDAWLAGLARWLFGPHGVPLE